MLPPLLDCERLPTNTSGRRRFRRRGPRSLEALQRRALRFNRKRSGEEDVGESSINLPCKEFKLQPLRILNCNIRSLMGKLAELIIVISMLNINVVCCQETWLDKSIEHPCIPNFSVVSRRDRKDDTNRGGVIIYAHESMNNISEYHKSVDAERIWALIQRDTGSIAVCNWYLPPGTGVQEIESFKAELLEMNAIADTVILVGDLNIHHVSWLKYSSGESNRGRRLKD